ncbi:hypothetical protein NM688_g6246 [Phlebia brevispora]|uniref:Uncharacterized protein n=1 Tax=Phlebia brevispora TaxID=194682 RepID=A0ACC1SIG8_9APHY|nr:hypothetical protein NM688_g6246 [Phlebia brevispora]
MCPKPTAAGIVDSSQRRTLIAQGLTLPVASKTINYTGQRTKCSDLGIQDTDLTLRPLPGFRVNDLPASGLRQTEYANVRQYLHGVVDLAKDNVDGALVAELLLSGPEPGRATPGRRRTLELQGAWGISASLGGCPRDRT